jgi:hypothetical protein
MALIQTLVLYKYFRSIISIFGFLGLAFNLLIFIIFLEYKDISFTFPALSGLLLSLISFLPDSLQDLIFNFFLSIKEYIFNYYLYLKSLLVRLLEYTFDSPNTNDKTEIGKTPLPKAGERADIYPINKGEDTDSLRRFYNKTKEHIPSIPEESDYTYYLIAGAVVIVTGFLIYYYWDSISNSFKPGGDKGKMRETFYDRKSGSYEEYMSEPSPNGYREYPEGYLNYFSRKLGDLSNEINNRAKELYSNTFGSLFKEETVRPPIIATRDLFVPGDNGGTTMWKGLPLPRTEYLENGDEYYLFLDKDNIVNILGNRIENNSLDLVNPLTGESIGRKAIDNFDKLNLLKNKTMRAYFSAPSDSYVRNPSITNIQLTAPDFNTLDISESSLPGSKTAPIEILNVNTERAAFEFPGEVTPYSQIASTSAIKPKRITEIIDPNATPKLNQ